MARQIPWLRILAEAVVIVASILLALAADAWLEGQRDQEEEAVLLSSVRAEISANLDLLDEWDSNLSRTSEHATALLNLASPNAQPINALRFDSLLIDAAYFRTYLPSTGSISSALGQLSLISSETLRQEVAGFHERLRDFQEHFDWRSDEGLAFISHVQSRIPLFTSNNTAWTEVDPGPDRRGILREVEFANLLGGLVYRNGRMTTESADFRAHLNRILDLIDAEQL